jgi:phage terminase large subunit GpA-like protein
MLSILEFYNRTCTYWEPPPRVTVSEWSDNNRVISKESSAEPGKWRTDRAPYQREIMDAVTQVDVEKVVVMSSSQVGKSEILNNVIGYYIDLDPCPMMLIEPADKLAEDYSKRRIAPLIRDTKCLSGKVSDSKTRDVNNTILLKAFPGGFLSMGGANAPGGLASRPIRILLCDEVDRYPDSAGTEGDPIQLADKRTITFWNRKKVFVSSPGIKGVSRIEKEYLAGTQEEWRIKCPHCGEYVFINIFNIVYNAEKDAKDNYVIKSIVFRCPRCKSDADEIAWKAQPGKWIAGNPKAAGTRSFHLNAFVSPWYTWNKIIAEYLAAKDDPELYKVFVNTVLGETYEVKGEIENEEFLLNRREEYGAELPEGVLLLTAAVDVMDKWMEYEVVGWGKGNESWGIKHGIVAGSPEKKETWRAIDDILKAEYHFKDGFPLIISCTCIDSGGHYTTEVYKYCRYNESRKVFAIKGMGGARIPLISKVTRIKSDNPDIRNTALIILGVDEGKTGVIESLQVKTPGPSYCHFPKNEDYDVEYFKGLISERLVPHKNKGKTTLDWEKVSSDVRNEPFDLRNYARAAVKLMQPVYEKWEERLKEVRNAGGITPQTVRKASPPKRVISSGLESDF